jgi:hypothetical protein
VPNVPKAHKSFWTHPIVLLVDEAEVEARSVRLEMLLILTQDRSTVCAELSRGLEIVLDTLDGTPR